jgi:5'-methylthioadenosine phosphorylase
VTAADIGAFGGSGFYAFLNDTESVELDTPWGRPSAPITIGSIGGKRVAFLPRHGLRHEYPPHRINYRANVDAMRQLGVRALLAPFAAGSLQREIKPGDFVVVDQLVDRTWGRESTFYDSFDTSGPQHAAFADPYDADLRAHLVDVAREQGITVHDGGTVVVVNGPRFSTRAESVSFRDAGWHVINMTQCPEAPLAREADLPFAGVALVTDYDAGLDDAPGIEAVTQEQVFAVFEQNVGRVRDLLLAVIPRL